MKILVTGLCTLHWGRLQYGNIGNYYIIEPLFRELHRVFPKAEIVTTFQMTQEFVEREKVTILPMDLYYAWQEDDVEKAQRDLYCAERYAETGEVYQETAYVKMVRQCSLVVNVSGDMWGDNAEHVGHNRFLVDLLKMRTAQLLGVKTVLFAGTPGPFSAPQTRTLAQTVFENFSLITNREPMATKNLEHWNFNLKNVQNFPCPSFLFEPVSRQQVLPLLKKENFVMLHDARPVVGFTICGFNMPEAPYDVWPRANNQYLVFAEAVEHIVNQLGARVMLFSHTNGFELPPYFKLINGRDYPINKQLQSFLYARGNIKDSQSVCCVEHPYVPAEMKAMLGTLDMVVTGRLHASVGTTSQCVPTVFIMHGKEFIRSTKIQGFAQIQEMEDFVCEADDSTAIVRAIDNCWENRVQVRQKLEKKIPIIQQQARSAFDKIADLVRE